MLLFVVRHAWAEERDESRWPDDALRPLTRLGRKRFARVAKHLVKCGFEPNQVATSPLIRCRQTSELLLDCLEHPPALTLLDSLAPGARAGELLPWLEHHPHAEQLALVGHGPDVGTITADFLGARGAALDFPKGGVACIEFVDRIVLGQGILRWLITAKILKL